MKKYPKIFDDLYCNLVAAGEAGGILDTILQRLAAYIEKNEKLKSQIKGAMMYPVITMTVAILVIIIIMVFVIPIFQDMFSEMGGSLPVLTQMVINMSNFIKSNFIYIGVAVGLALYGLKRFKSTDKGREIWDRIMLSAPVFGDLTRKVAVAKFTRTLSTMMSSGVPIIASLDIVARTAGNVIVGRGHHGHQGGHRRRAVHRRPPGRERRLPPDGRADDFRGRGDRSPGRHAREDRQFL